MELAVEGLWQLGHSGRVGREGMVQGSAGSECGGLFIIWLTGLSLGDIHIVQGYWHC